MLLVALQQKQTKKVVVSILLWPTRLAAKGIHTHHTAPGVQQTSTTHKN